MCHPEMPSNAAAPVVRADEVQIPLGAAEMPAFVASPPRDGDHGAVIVIGDIFGARTPFYEHLARLLAAAGFDAFVPEYFFRAGPLAERTPEAAYARKALLDERRALDDLEATAEWVRRRAGFSGRRVGVVGFCLGGTFALDLAARRDDLATVCYYGFPAGPPGPPGDPDRTAPKPLEVVDLMTGPILGFWGSDDERVGMDNVAALADALSDRNVDFRHTILAGLDHGFLASSFETDAEDDPGAATWVETVRFLEQNA